MAGWRIDQRYGSGAANVRLCAEPYDYPGTPPSVLASLRRIHRELHDQGHTLRRVVTVAPAVAMCVVILFFFVATVLRDRSDVSGIEIVMLRSTPAPALEPPPPPARPEHTVEVATIRPAPPPPPVPVTPPPPRAKPVPKPEPAALRVRPQITIDAVAAVAPPPTARGGRRPLEPPRRDEPPVVDVKPVAKVAVVPDGGAQPVGRFAAVRPRASARPVLDARVPMIAGLPAEAAPAAPRSTRHTAPRTARPAARTAPIPPLFAPEAPVAPVAARASAPRRAARAAPAPSEQRSIRPAGLASPALAPSVPGAGSDSRATAAARGEPRSAVPAARSDRARPVASLSGVPLGSLASCVSDREEDRLKQRLVAAVTTQERCVSRAGTYRFVETKNLNSFLLWVDRAPGRKEGDRCVELRLALECLAR